MNLLWPARLRRARELLATKNVPVDQIARRVGFSSRSNFSHAIRTALIQPTSVRFRSVVRSFDAYCSLCLRVFVV